MPVFTIFLRSDVLRFHKIMSLVDASVMFQVSPWLPATDNLLSVLGIEPMKAKQKDYSSIQSVTTTVLPGFWIPDLRLYPRLAPCIRQESNLHIFLGRHHSPYTKTPPVVTEGAVIFLWIFAYSVYTFTLYISIKLSRTAGLPPSGSCIENACKSKRLYIMV